MSSCHLLRGCPLDLFPLLGCHSVQRLVHLLSFILAIWLAHFHFCFSVYSIISIIFVLFLISEHGILFCGFRSNIFLSIALWAVLNMFVICLLRDHVWQPLVIVGKTHWSISCFLSEMRSCLAWKISLFFPKQPHAALILAYISS